MELATELIHEVKQSARRWFIAFIIVVVLWFLTIGGFMWYISLPVDEVNIEDVSQESQNSGENIISGGDVINGEADSR